MNSHLCFLSHNHIYHLDNVKTTICSKSLGWERVMVIDSSLQLYLCVLDFEVNLFLFYIPKSPFVSLPIFKPCAMNCLPPIIFQQFSQIFEKPYQINYTVLTTWGIISLIFFGVYFGNLDYEQITRIGRHAPGNTLHIRTIFCSST